MIRFTSDYDRNAVRPVPGSLWAWEPDSAPALIRVTGVTWNGEQWFVRSLTLAEYVLPLSIRTRHVVNELSRFWEACRYVNAEPGPSGRRGVSIRIGPPQEDELLEGDDGDRPEPPAG